VIEEGGSVNDSEGDNGEKGGGGCGGGKDRERKSPSWVLAIQFIWLRFHDDLNVKFDENLYKGILGFQLCLKNKLNLTPP